jgi:LysM repeat protein
LFTVLLGLTAASPASALAAVDGCVQTHTVVSGEYLTKIATQYNTSWLTLATLNKLEDANLIYPGQVLCISTGGTTTTPPPVTGSVRVYAASAVEDKAVTLKGKTLDINSSYTVYLSNYKLTTYIDTLVGTAKTDASGNFTQSFTIPKNLFDVALIRVTLVNSRGDKAAHWFTNTTGSVVGGIGSAAITVTLDEVKEGDWVKITASNLPANVTFQVFVAKGDSTGSILVGQVSSSSGGKVTATFDLPSEYEGRTKLEVQLKNDSVNMSVIKDFDND